MWLAFLAFDVVMFVVEVCCFAVGCLLLYLLCVLLLCFVVGFEFGWLFRLLVFLLYGWC